MVSNNMTNAFQPPKITSILRPNSRDRKIYERAHCIVASPISPASSFLKSLSSEQGNRRKEEQLACEKSARRSQQH